MRPYLVFAANFLANFLQDDIPRVSLECQILVHPLMNTTYCERSQLENSIYTSATIVKHLSTHRRCVIFSYSLRIHKELEPNYLICGVFHN